MKVSELFEKEEQGTYAGVRFSPSTNDALIKYTKDNKIPKPIKPDEIHTTLLFSRKYLPDYKPAGKLGEPMVGTPTNLDIWPSQPNENGKTKTF